MGNNKLYQIQKEEFMTYSNIQQYLEQIRMIYILETKIQINSGYFGHSMKTTDPIVNFKHLTVDVVEIIK